MKKNRFAIIIILTFILISLSSCKKDECETCDCISKQNSDFVISYDDDCIDIIKIDSTIKIIASPNDSTNQDFDIDRDGIPDFEIQSSHNISDEGWTYQKSSIKIVNSSFQISVVEFSDTLHRYTRFIEGKLSYYSYYNTYSNKIIYWDSWDGIDTVFNPPITYLIPKVYSIGDTLKNYESWSSDDLTLTYFYRSSTYRIEPAVYYLIVRGNWNNQNMKYVVFRKEVNSEYLYGWLRLSINKYKEVRFYEYSIQKNINKMTEAIL